MSRAIESLVGIIQHFACKVYILCISGNRFQNPNTLSSSSDIKLETSGKRIELRIDNVLNGQGI